MMSGLNISGGSLKDVAQMMAQTLIPEKDKQRIDEDVMHALTQRILLSAATVLPKQAQDPFGALLESNPQPEEIDAFLRNHIDRYEEFIGNVVTKFLAQIQREE